MSRAAGKSFVTAAPSFDLLAAIVFIAINFNWPTDWLLELDFASLLC